MIPYVAFIILIIVGLRMHEIDLKGALIFTTIFISTPYIAGFFAMPGYMSVVVNVILDIVLIFKIFGGDVRIW